MQSDLFGKPLHRIHASTAGAADSDLADIHDETPRPTRRLRRHRFWNFIIGLGLLPFAWILTCALFNALSKATPQNLNIPFWMTHEFLMFAVGGALWIAWTLVSLCIWREPRPVRLYVWGHELTHAGC